MSRLTKAEFIKNSIKLMYERECFKGKTRINTLVNVTKEGTQRVKIIQEEITINENKLNDTRSEFRKLASACVLLKNRTQDTFNKVASDIDKIWNYWHNDDEIES